MILTIDIGNTNIVLGVFDGETLRGTYRLETPKAMAADEVRLMVERTLKQAQVEARLIVKAVVGSVVPAFNDRVADACQAVFGRRPIEVSARVKLPVLIDVDYPEQVGADRIANAAAGYVRYGGPCLIVDFGTATTFDVVSAAGAYIGGAIVPGPRTAMADLVARTAQLFEVEIEPPEKVIGRSTEQALKSGFFYGTVGQVDYLIERIIAEADQVKSPPQVVGHRERWHIVATGGLAGRIEYYSHLIQKVDPHLTLDGLRLIGEMN